MQHVVTDDQFQKTVVITQGKMNQLIIRKIMRIIMETDIFYEM
jgi:hypothetical protein